MARWDSLFINELNHEYARYVESKDEEKFKEVLTEAFNSGSDFKVAYALGFVEWVRSQGVELNVELPEMVVLNPPVYPPVYMEPSFIKYLPEYIKQALPEFKKYGIVIRRVGDSA